MVFVLALAPVLSRTTFGDDWHVWGIALMSVTLLFGGISAGQSALLQGLRRLRDLAVSQIVGAIFGSVISVLLVWWLRDRGVVPFLVAISAFGILLSWWYARQVPVQRVTVTWKETFTESRGLLVMGMAFTAAALISSGTTYLTRVLVQHQLGMAAVGIYTATWTLSTYYVGFVLTAMGADFLPRLTEATGDHGTMNRLINEQTEMGVLIAVPGVLATLTFAPWVMRFFYSGDFVQGAVVVQWQILGVFLRVISWPLAYVLIAKGKSLLFTITELTYGVVGVALILLCMKVWKLEGIGVSFALSYLFYTAMMLAMAWRLIGFRWSGAALRIIAVAVLILAGVFVCMRSLPECWSLTIGLSATVLSGVATLLALQRLLGLSLWQLVRRKLLPQSP